MNIYQKAKKGIITPEVEQVAQQEDLPVQSVIDSLARGEIAVVKNSTRSIKASGVGKGLRTKVNANIGSSPDLFDLDMELQKLDAAVQAGADAVMDLSTGGNIPLIRAKILEHSPIPLGTVPIYEVAVSMMSRKKSLMDMTLKDFLEVVERQAREGVDFMTIHSGITLESVRSLKSQERIIPITSRGGSILAEWMAKNKKENPLYEHYDEILDIMAQYNVIISLGDGLRPGANHDANDRGQIHEMIVLGDLARRAREKGVQAIIEGPGHMPLDKIADNIRLQKSLCDGAPYYVLGPLVTDVAPGYDHITSAIGGAVAAAAGADFLCYVTPAEHLRLPTVQDVWDGVIAARIAGHAADIVKLGERARKWDDDMSRARRDRHWPSMYDLALDRGKATKMRQELPSDKDDQCSMCGEFCAIKREI